VESIVPPKTMPPPVDSRNATASSPALPAAILTYLKLTQPWVRFISIMGFLATGFLFVLGLALILGAGILSSLSHSAFGGAPVGLIGLLYSAMACLNFFPALYLYRFASGIQRALRGEDIHGVEEALRNQKSFWRFVGILLLLVLVMQFLMILGIAGAFVLGKFGGR
jgi:hypothetical protein